MRALLIPLLLLTAACRKEEAPLAEAAAGTDAISIYAGEGRDRLCLALNGGAAGVITYAASGDSNCTVRGSFSAGSDSRIKPNGDERCAIDVAVDGDRVTLNGGGEACAYYCGPGASPEAKTFVRMDNPDEVKDFAGDPLC